MNWIWRNKHWLFCGVGLLFLWLVYGQIIVPAYRLFGQMNWSWLNKRWLFLSIGLNVIFAYRRIIVLLACRLSGKRDFAPAAPPPPAVPLPLNTTFTKPTPRDISRRD
jgi:hypothetical protein